MEGIKEPYYVWILVCFDPDAMRVKFYNAANQEEPEELRGDLRKIVWKHPRVVVGIITHYPHLVQVLRGGEEERYVPSGALR